MCANMQPSSNSYWKQLDYRDSIQPWVMMKNYSLTFCHSFSSWFMDSIVKNDDDYVRLRQKPELAKLKSFFIILGDLLCARLQPNENKVFIWIESTEQTFCSDYCRLLVHILWVEKAPSHFSHLILQQTIFFKFIFSSACFHWLNKNICFCRIRCHSLAYTSVLAEGDALKVPTTSSSNLFNIEIHSVQFLPKWSFVLHCSTSIYNHTQYVCHVTLCCGRQMAGHFLCDAVTSSSQILALIFYDKM